MIDAIYCNSLSRLESRRNQSIQLLDPLTEKYPVYFHEAVDWKNVTIDDFKKSGFHIYPDWMYPTDFTWKMIPSRCQFWWNRPLKMGSMCNSIGHYSIWNHALESGYDSIVMFEDDCVFDLGELYVALDLYETKYYQNCDVFYLGTWPVEVEGQNRSYVDDYVEGVDYTYNTHAYILNSKSLEKLVHGGLREKMITIDEYVSASHAIHPRRDIEDNYNFDEKLVAQRVIVDVVDQIGYYTDGENWSSDDVK